MQDKSEPAPHNAEVGHDIKADLAKSAAEDEGLKGGLAKLVLDGPVGITLYIAWNFITLVDAWVKPYVPRIYNPDSYLPFPVPGVGLVFAVVLLTVIGALAGRLLGRSLISAGELMLGRMPIVRNVYRG